MSSYSRLVENDTENDFNDQFIEVKGIEKEEKITNKWNVILWYFFEISYHFHTSLINVTVGPTLQLLSIYAGYENSKVDSMINQKYNKKACDMTKEEYDNVVEGLQKIADAKNKVGA